MRESLIIAIGAALGGNARYWLTNLFVARFGPTFPWGTLFINVSGSLLIGFVLTVLGQRLIADPTYRLLLVTGFLGAYTTFSTFSFDTVTLISQGEYGPALGNVVGSLAGGVLATFGGIWLGRWLA